MNGGVYWRINGMQVHTYAVQSSGIHARARAQKSILLISLFRGKSRSFSLRGVSGRPRRWPSVVVVVVVDF